MSEAGALLVVPRDVEAPHVLIVTHAIADHEIRTVDALCRPSLDLQQDWQERDRLLRQIKDNLRALILEPLRGNGLTTRDFAKLDDFCDVSWKQLWLQLLLDHDRIIEDIDRYVRCPQWHINDVRPWNSRRYPLERPRLDVGTTPP